MKKLTLAEHALSDNVWIETNDYKKEILCVKMIDGRISRQIINRAKQGRFTVTPLAKPVEDK